jgi:hypothetical protein
MNKGNQPEGDGQKPAESVEQRSLAKGNTRRVPTAETLGSGKVSRGLLGVREAARRDKIKRELRRRFQDPVPETGRWLRQVLQGYYRFHPWPNVRFRRRYPRQEPYAVIPHVRICTGGAS